MFVGFEKMMIKKAVADTGRWALLNMMMWRYLSYSSFCETRVNGEVLEKAGFESHLYET